VPARNHGAEPSYVYLGNKQQTGGRNSPSAYNVAGHVAQFGDGRSAHIEHHATQPSPEGDGHHHPPRVRAFVYLHDSALVSITDSSLAFDTDKRLLTNADSLGWNRCPHALALGAILLS